LSNRQSKGKKEKGNKKAEQATSVLFVCAHCIVTNIKVFFKKNTTNKMVSIPATFVLLLLVFVIVTWASPPQGSLRRLVLEWDSNRFHIHHWMWASLAAVICVLCCASPFLAYVGTVFFVAVALSGLLWYSDWWCLSVV
jgi:hypothetical protein